MKSFSETFKALRKERNLTQEQLAEASLQAIREDRVVGINALAQLCDLLDLQPGDIIEYKK